MESIKGIQKHIEYRKSVEKKRPVLTTDSRIITIDGVDGVGKSSIAKKLYQKFCKVFGESSVVFVDITNLCGSPKQERLKEIIQKNNLPKKIVDRMYIAGINRAYKEVVLPSLEAGKFVIVDRSEVDLLRYAMEDNNEESINERKKNIQDGTTTHRLWAGNRIFIRGVAKDIWNNLLERKKLSAYDPKSLDEVQNRLSVEQKAEKTILSMQCEGTVNVVESTVHRVDDQLDREHFLGKIVEDIFVQLKLNN